jgi:hypothetical protein
MKKKIYYETEFLFLLWTRESVQKKQAWKFKILIFKIKLNLKNFSANLLIPNLPSSNLFQWEPVLRRRLISS